MNRWQTISGAVLLCVALATASSSPEGDAVDRYIEMELKRQHVPGAAVAVVHAGKLEKAKGYGLADVELRVPVTVDTVFQWASITKQFTAEAILLLAEEGRLQLDDRIAAHYTNAPATWSNITIRHLLTHTSGLRNYTSLPGFWTTIRGDYTPDGLIALVRDMPLDFEPGEKMAYCNTGYFLLGLVIEKASGQSYAKFLTDRILTPLHMGTARANHRFELIPHRASGYDYTSNQLWRAEFASPTQQGGAGVLVGSLMDLVRWDEALQSDKLLPRSAREKMWSPARLNNGKVSNYGYGWRIGDRRGHRFVAHSGRNHGFTTHFVRFLDDKLTVIVLLNANGDPEALAHKIASHYVRGLTLATMDPQPDPDPNLTAQLERCLAEMAARKDSDMLSADFRKAFSRSRNRHAALVADMAAKRGFTFVSNDPPPSDNPEGVTRLAAYRLSTGATSRIYIFALTAGDKVAGLDIQN